MDDITSLSYRPSRSDSLIAFLKAFTIAASLCLLVTALAWTYTRFHQSASAPTSTPLSQGTLNPIATISYTAATNPDLGHYLVPLVTMPIAINNLNQDVTFLIDTGAIITALPMDYAQKTGLDLTTLKRMLLSSLTSQTIFGYLTTMKATLNGHELTLPVSFAPIDTPVLGRYGFMDTYTLVFDHQNQAVIVANDTPSK